MLIGETVTRLRKEITGTDRYDNPVYADEPAELTLTGAAFDPGGSLEPAEVGRTPVITSPTVYFSRQWPDLLATDQLRVRGKVYDVVGDPGDWRSPFGSPLGGLAVPVRRVEG